ncbi:DUF5703 family protein [Nesterenkonia flava]|uniref:DUF5703 family protein n=1 Tax=Nesterenkonia flava TaxID=469799 RepID=A0ABU1FQZ9_9MICC|nr:DUF5703 family protein [Nesterenkonia flava]MDR5710692.1 DUF5703 family protein [Nesterenkonia flava]
MAAQHSSPLPAARYTTQNGDGTGWQYLVLTCQPHESLAEVRRRIVDHAEYGKWELRRSSIYSGGVRKYWLRRRLMRVERTL